MKIGITSGKTLNRKYIEAVESVGGEYVVLTPQTNIKNIFDTCERIIFSGGGDIAPEFFGINTYDGGIVNSPDKVRDEFELELAHTAFEKNIPTLGICRGIRIMNVAMGGSLKLDIGGHMQKEPKNIPTHLVKICDDTEFVSKGSEFKVNSFHHRAIDIISKKLSIFALSPDGIIEGIKCNEKYFFIGVQWHPEQLCDTQSLRIFRNFAKV